ncbi:NDP-hexose 2,3-dehydratase family protein [Actinomadura terrae]|uniref:NDP-hexose 2,3-dehydratase family protein n=1 Tax=Actinomadura terrae TaxID=604353 RepID=UPI001FA79FC7|nr:NDP-hexose 2,3-dehydratase family protein [Actinomadura terrae]
MSTPTAAPLRRRAEPDPAVRLARSAATTEGVDLTTEDVPGWMAERLGTHEFQVDRVPFTDLDGWYFDGTTGDLRHRSGRFFSVEGLHTRVTDTTGAATTREWAQPILSQPEIGILGLLVKDFDGVPHILTQAKMEPGNSNRLQLSPTVQATWSNYNRVHQGAAVRYLEFFNGPGRGPVLADVLQSEQGAWFYRKVNRNVIVEARGEVPPHEDFRWLTVGQIGRLLHHDTVVSMDLRSALSCLPFDRAEAVALHSDTDVLSWFTGMRSRYDVRAHRIPLADVPGWARTDSVIEHPNGRYFRIVGVSVRAGSREVGRWAQPLLEPTGQGVAAFLSCRIEGVRHVLAHARAEAGFAGSVEIGPTVQCMPGNYADRPAEDRPAFLDRVLAADPAHVRYSAVQSEEGGRFLNADNRYLVVDVAEPFEPPPDYRWLSHGQLNLLVRHGHYLNVQARTLLAGLNAMPAAER